MNYYNKRLLHRFKKNTSWYYNFCLEFLHVNVNIRSSIFVSQCSDRLSNTAAATSPSEDVNIKMASARDRCVVANSINRVVQYNANSELLDRRKQDPTSASSYDNVISNNATSSNRNHVVDLRPSQLVPSADSKHCGGDAQHLSVNLSVGNMVDTSLLSAYGGGFCGDVTRAGIKSDGVVWCDPLCSRVSDVVENAPRKGFSTADAAATEMWFYKDPNGEIQGKGCWLLVWTKRKLVIVAGIGLSVYNWELLWLKYEPLPSLALHFNRNRKLDF